MWAEVALVGQKQMHKLVLEGKGVQDRVDKGGLDVNIFKLVNFLQISQAKLTSLPDTLCCLNNITSLVLKGNSLTGIPTSLNNLIKLKLFDLSLNKFIGFNNSPEVIQILLNDGTCMNILDTHWRSKVSSGRRVVE